MTPPPDAERLALWLRLGCRVRGVATLRHAQRRAVQHLSLLWDVELETGDVYEHLWVADLAPYVRRVVAAGERFRFEGLVAPYARMRDGSEDVMLKQVRWLGKG